MSDHKGARLVLDALPPASHLIADRGYDSAWIREEREARGIEPCIPSSRSRKVPYAYDTTLYHQHHKVENLFAKLKDWRRIATRYDRCAHTSFSAICVAAAVIFWLWSMSPELSARTRFWSAHHYEVCEFISIWLTRRRLSAMIVRPCSHRDYSPNNLDRHRD